jgi:hypothetical protein
VSRNNKTLTFGPLFWNRDLQRGRQVGKNIYTTVFTPHISDDARVPEMESCSVPSVVKPHAWSPIRYELIATYI